MPDRDKGGKPRYHLTQEHLLELVPFTRVVGIELASATQERVEGRVAWTPGLCTADGVMHGGALMTLADILGAASAFLNLPRGIATSTIESKTSFLGAVREGHVAGVSRPLHPGRSTIVVQTDHFDADGRHVAHTTQTQAVIGLEREEARP